MANITIFIFDRLANRESEHRNNVNAQTKLRLFRKTGTQEFISDGERDFSREYIGLHLVQGSSTCTMRRHYCVKKWCKTRDVYNYTVGDIIIIIINTVGDI